MFCSFGRPVLVWRRYFDAPGLLIESRDRLDQVVGWLLLEALERPSIDCQTAAGCCCALRTQLMSGRSYGGSEALRLKKGWAAGECDDVLLACILCNWPNCQRNVRAVGSRAASQLPLIAVNRHIGLRKMSCTLPVGLWGLREERAQWRRDRAREIRRSGGGGGGGSQSEGRHAEGRFRTGASSCRRPTVVGSSRSQKRASSRYG